MKEVVVMASTLLQIEIDDDLLKQATTVFEELGIDITTAVRVFLKRSVIANGIPFSMTLPKRDPIAEQAVRALREQGLKSIRNGTSELTLDEINAEIDAARRERDQNKV